MKPAKIRLLVFDLDHTALGGQLPYHRFPRTFVRFLDELPAEGIQWATNTTWGLDLQLSLIVNSGVKSTPAFLAGGTGRFLARVEDGRLVPDEEYYHLVAARDKRFRQAHWPMIRSVLKELLARNLIDELSFNEQNVVFIRIRKYVQQLAEPIFRPLLQVRGFYKFDPTDETNILLLPLYMNKGGVIKVMQERLGVVPGSTIVAGDGNNDLPMFDPRCARFMVCPANASEPVKEVVRSFGGVVATKPYAEGVMEGVAKILRDQHR